MWHVLIIYDDSHRVSFYTEYPWYYVEVFALSPWHKVVSVTATPENVYKEADNVARQDGTSREA